MVTAVVTVEVATAAAATAAMTTAAVAEVTAAADRTICRGLPEAPAYPGMVPEMVPETAAVAVAKGYPLPPHPTTLQTVFSGTLT